MQERCGNNAGTMWEQCGNDALKRDQEPLLAGEDEGVPCGAKPGQNYVIGTDSDIFVEVWT